MAEYKSSMTPEKALAGFGLGCAQHVFGEFAPQLGMDRETALKIASLFGSGMFEGGVCGAVVGGLMAIGLRFGQGDDPDPARQERLQQKGAEFKARYAELYGSCICKEILGHKLPEELEQIEAENKFVTVCSRAISDACTLCAEILNEE